MSEEKKFDMFYNRESRIWRKRATLSFSEFNTILRTWPELFEVREDEGRINPDFADFISRRAFAILAPPELNREDVEIFLFGVLIKDYLNKEIDPDTLSSLASIVRVRIVGD